MNLICGKSKSFSKIGAGLTQHFRPAHKSYVRDYKNSSYEKKVLSERQIA